MKQERLIIVLLLLAFVNFAYSQTKSNAKPVKTTTTSNKSTLKGVLLPSDYKYYLLVHRGSSDAVEAKPYYTLSTNTNYLSPAEGNFSGYGVILDIRTGKEVSWWPGKGETYYSKKHKMLFNRIPGSRDHLLGFDSTGVFKYDIEMATVSKGSALDRSSVKLSTDWSKGYLIFNNDIWKVDFDITKGQFSTPTQLTFNGAMTGEILFVKGENAIVGQQTFQDDKMINLTTGKFKEIDGDWINNNTYITDWFYATDINDPSKSGWWSLEKQLFLPSSPKSFHSMWLNRTQTKALLCGFPTYNGQGGLTDNDQPAFSVKDFEAKKPSVPIPTPYMSSSAKSFLFMPNGFTGVAGASDGLLKEFSPDSSRLLLGNAGWVGGNRSYWTKETGVVVLDVKNLTEKVIPIPFTDNQYKWMDNSHIIFNAKSGTKIANEEITTATQGTYIYDLNTNSYKRISNYLINEINTGMTNLSIDVWSFAEVDFVVFRANDILFRCRPDGSELTPIVKFPGLYAINARFLSTDIELR